MAARMDPKLKTLAGLVGMVVFMVSLGFASVPLYDWFCRVTGYGGTTLEASAAPDEVLERTMNIRFDGSLSKDMRWEFKPMEREMTVRIGETGDRHARGLRGASRPDPG